MRRTAFVASLTVLLSLLFSAPASGIPSGTIKRFGVTNTSAEISGAVEYGTEEGSTSITECPQAGMKVEPQELRRREIDQVEQLSGRGDDVRTNLEYSCNPQNETSVAINPTNFKNVLTTQNDYRTFSRQGFGSSVDGGKTYYDGELPPLSIPNGDVLDASGDPVSVFDRAGVAYSSSINFNRTDDENGITVQRSTNGGFTWSRPCVPIRTAPAPSEAGRCGGAGDPRQPGDGVVTYFDDPDATLNGNVDFDDKEWMAAGPRPAGITATCFTPFTRTARACDPDVVGIDRLYVTWTRFNAAGTTAEINISFSDDEARSWSPAKPIGASAPFCAFGVSPAACDVSQFSVPTVHPRTGLLGVAFENFNTPAENQYLFVRSIDGSATFQGPFFITPVFDVNYPRSGAQRADCGPRGQQGGRAVLTNSCFRVNSGGNVVVDKRGGEGLTGAALVGENAGFADDFYMVFSDNRNGTPRSSNVDVFTFRSTDGGMTWIGPTRVNNDGSAAPANRDCNSSTDPNCTRAFGNDQWFPWIDISSKGVLAAGFHDRRLDTNSTRGEWPTSRAAPNGRPGNYLAWFFGAGCKITTTARVTGATTALPADARECTAPGATAVAQPTAPVAPPAGAVPGQGPSFLGPFRNQRVSDVPHNLDYAFRAGIFMGDYNNVAFPNVPGSADGRGNGNDDDDDDDGDSDNGRNDQQAVGFWTDSRNGRGSGGPSSLQPGRNPACEQADVWLDYFQPLANGPLNNSVPLDPFLVTPCPGDGAGERDDDHDGDGKKDKNNDGDDDD